MAETADPVSMTVAVQFAAVGTVALSIPFWHLSDIPRFASFAVLAPIAISGVLVHALATLLFIYGLNRVKAGIAATMFPLTSLLTVLGGLIYFQEPLSLLQGIGGVLVILAALATAWCISR